MLARRPHDIHEIVEDVVGHGDALAELQLEAAIKWPNDVLLGGKKVAGVLAESIWNGESLSATILGIGINVLEGSAPSSQTLFPATTLESERLTIQMGVVCPPR